MNSKTPLRVCILIPILDLGGAEVQVLDQLRVLDRSGLRVSICCLTAGDAGMESEARRYADSFFHLSFRWRSLPFAVLRLARYLREERFDVIHCHMPPADWVGRLAGWLGGVPVRMTTEHGRGLWKSQCRVMFDRVLNSVTDLRICVSHDILEIRAQREGTPRSKLEYLPNGVDLDRFKSTTRGKQEIMAELGWPADDPLVVSVGRLVSEKNYPLLVEAIASVKDSIPTVRCVIAGEGKRRNEIDSHIEKTGAGENIKLVGSRNDIADLLHAADVFVLASIREGFPVSLIEAMACGKAIVATDVGGIPDAIAGGENGLLVQPGDAPALSEAISRLLVDKDLAGNMGRAALETAAEKFSLQHVVQRTKEIYFNLYRRKTA
jgi:glycosyltransferase involved in cell wall biosynthesis